jgi:hypothetical protein
MIKHSCLVPRLGISGGTKSRDWTHGSSPDKPHRKNEMEREKYQLKKNSQRNNISLVWQKR